ncbi:MAG: FAD-binding oxidoreductase [Pseudomonadales bacterium]
MNMTAVLNECFDGAQIRRDAQALEVYGQDWTRLREPAPSAVVFPKTNEEVQRLVRLARREDLKLVPSGGRTGLSGGAVAAQGEIVVSFEKMNQILGFNGNDRLLHCQAGVVTQVLQDYAQEQGLYYPVDFASAGSSCIGGNIATNAGGIKVIRYGLTRDWVAGLTVVTGTGELLSLNHGLVKNATGYDLRHLFVGSEGTLGMIVEAQVRLTKAPLPQQVMVLGVPKVTDLLAVLSAFQDQLTLSAFEFFSQLCLDKVIAHRDLPAPLAEPAAFYALLEYDETASEQALAVFEALLGKGLITDGVLSQSQAQAAALWALREGISEAIAPDLPYKNDLAVCISEVPEFLAEIDSLVARGYPDFEVCWYGHIGDGNLHLNILKPAGLNKQEFFERCHEMSPKLFAAVAQRHGSISAEHGVGLLKQPFLGYSRSTAEIELMRQLKAVFDPDQVLNPGKLLPS